MRSGLFDLFKAASEKERRRGEGYNFDYLFHLRKKEFPELSDEAIREKVKSELASGSGVLSGEELSAISSYEWSPEIFHRFSKEDLFWISCGIAVADGDFGLIKDWMGSVGLGEYKDKVSAKFSSCLNFDLGVRGLREAFRAGYSYFKGLSDAWHLDLAKRQDEEGAAAAERGEEEGYWDKDGSNIKFVCSNGWVVRYIPAVGEMQPWKGDEKTSHDRVAEGNKMGICLGSELRLYQNNSFGKIYSLRNGENKPQITLRISEDKIEEIRAKGNSMDFSPAKALCVLEFLKFMELDPFDSDRKAFGLYLALRGEEIAKFFTAQSLDEFIIERKWVRDESFDMFKDGVFFFQGLQKIPEVMKRKDLVEVLFLFWDYLVSKNLGSKQSSAIFSSEVAVNFFNFGFHRIPEFAELKQKISSNLGEFISKTDSSSASQFFSEGLDKEVLRDSSFGSEEERQDFVWDLVRSLSAPDFFRLDFHNKELFSEEYYESVGLGNLDDLINENISKINAVTYFKNNLDLDSRFSHLSDGMKESLLKIVSDSWSGWLGDAMKFFSEDLHLKESLKDFVEDFYLAIRNGLGGRALGTDRSLADIRSPFFAKSSRGRSFCLELLDRDFPRIEAAMKEELENHYQNYSAAPFYFYAGLWRHPKTASLISLMIPYLSPVTYFEQLHLDKTPEGAPFLKDMLARFKEERRHYPAGYSEKDLLSQESSLEPALASLVEALGKRGYKDLAHSVRYVIRGL